MQHTHLMNPIRKKRKRPAETRACVDQSNLARIHNVPDFTHLSTSLRRRALEQHEQWEALLADTPRHDLHRSICVRKDGSIPRETTCWLIKEYCSHQKVYHDTLLECITKANGNVNDPKLTTKNGLGVSYVNLFSLDNATLWRVYQQIPVHQRETKAPVPVDGGLAGSIHATPLPAAPPVEDEEVFWACCDACSKWRRVLAEPSGDHWECSAILLSCDEPEEEMEEGERWEGEVKGSQSSALPSAVPSEAPVSGEEDALDHAELFGEEEEAAEAGV